MPKFLIAVAAIICILALAYLTPGFAPRVSAAVSQPSTSDWWTAGANPQRTSWVSEEVRGDLKPEWYRPIEPYIPYKVQPIATNGKIYISTSKGLYAFNAQSGNVDWVYPTELPLGNSPTVTSVNNQLVAYVGGYDRKIHAIDASTGKDISGYTAYEAGAGFESNPLVVNNTIYAGNRDGKFYALDAITGNKKWEFVTGGPIHFSAAFKNGVIYFASDDMYAYALREDGNQLWKSQKLPGAGFASQWPVVYTEKVSGKDYVIFTGSDNFRMSDGTSANYFRPYLQGIDAANIFPCYPDSCSNTITWPTSTLTGTANYWGHDVNTLDVSAISSYYKNKPQFRSTFILNAGNGTEYMNANGEYVPFSFSGVTGSGNKYPPIVGPDNVLYGDTVFIGQSMPRGFAVGWKWGERIVSLVGPDKAFDEPRAYAVGGKVLYWSLCCDREAGAVDVTTISGDKDWYYYGYNLMGQAPDYDPMYNDGNNTRYTNGDGWQSYAGKSQSTNNTYGKHGTTQSPPIPYQGKVYMLRGNTLIAWSPTATTPNKLPLAAIVSTQNAPTPLAQADLQGRLEAEVQKMITAGHLRPGYFSAGFYDLYGVGQYDTDREFGEIFDYFQNPADTVVALLQARPYLSATTQSQLDNYLKNNYGPGSTYDFEKIVHIGWRNGAQREASDIPPEDFAWFGGNYASPLDPSSSPICGACGYWRSFPPFNFYAAWKYAQVYGGAKEIFDSMNGKLESPPSDAYLTKERPYMLNLYIAGYQGYLELQKLAGYPESSGERTEYDRLLSLKVNTFNKDVAATNNYFGPAYMNYYNALAPGQNFMFMTPELGDYMNKNLLTKVQEAMQEYQYVTPYWFVSKYDNSTGEGTFQPLYQSPALFQAKAYIMKEPYDELVKWLDVPAFARGDLFYIQNLVAALKTSPGGSTPASTSTPNPTPTPCTLTSASWSGVTAIQGDSVGLKVTSGGPCTGQQVSFEVRRNGLPFIGDIAADTQPSPVTLTSSNQTSGTWIAEYNPQFPGTDPEYYFKATLTGGNTVQSSQLLKVTRKELTIAEISDNSATYPNSQIPKYEKFEVTFKINNTVAKNLQMPYDPNPPAGVTEEIGSGITVNAEFSQDNFTTVYTQPAFYYQDFNNQTKNGKEWIYPNGQYSWKVRFAPSKEGVWQYKLTAQDASGTVTSSVQSFAVAASDNPGFVRVSKNDPRYFEFDDGTYFPGLGYNLNYDLVSWANPILDNQTNFQKMGQNGIQLTRIWLSEWSIFGSAWNTWTSLRNDYGGYIPRTGLTVFKPNDTDFGRMTLKLAYEESGGSKNTSWFDACRMTSGFQPKAPVKPNTDYHLKIRYYSYFIDGPRNNAFPNYGFVAKLQNPGDGNWHTSCYEPGTNNSTGMVVSPYVHDSNGWATLEGDINSGSSDFLPPFYLALENVKTATLPPQVYIDYVELREKLPDGTLGVDILPKSSMSQQLYFAQRNSYAFDQALDLAHKEGIYFKPVILEKGEDTLNSIGYNGNFTDSTVGTDYSNFYGDYRNITKVRWLDQAWWRYLQARWGYSTNIQSWELLNEGDPASDKHYTLADELGKYMRQFAPNNHLVTTSFWHSFPKDQFWANTSYPNVDFADVHQYVPKNTDPTHYFDTALSTIDASSSYGAKEPGGAGKPVMRGEVGFTGNGTEPGTSELLADTGGIWLHKLIWGGINPGGLIESYWYSAYEPYGHIYTSAFDQRDIYGTYYNFIKDISLNNSNYVDATATASDTNLRVLGQKDPGSGKAHLWIDNKNHTWKNVVDKVAITPISGTVTLAGMPPGTYSLIWFDTYTSAVSSTTAINSDASGNIIIPITNLAKDAAVKLEKQTVATPTPVPSPTATPAPIITPSPTSTPASTPSPTPTPTATSTPSPIPASTPSPSSTITPTPTPELTATPSPKPTHNPSVTPKPHPQKGRKNLLETFFSAFLETLKSQFKFNWNNFRK